MAVHFKQEKKVKREKRQFELACEEARRKRLAAEKQTAWNKRIADLFARAATLLNLPRPNPDNYETPTEWDRDIRQWETECEAVLAFAAATHRPYWVNKWRKDLVLRLTLQNRNAAA